VPGTSLVMTLAIWFLQTAPVPCSGAPVTTWVQRVGTPNPYGSPVVDAISIGADGRLYLAGDFSRTVDFDPGESDESYTAQGDDAYLTGYSERGEYYWTRIVGGPTDEGFRSLLISSTGTILGVGSFHGETDFDPGPGIDLHSPVGDYNGFVARFTPTGDYLGVVIFGDGNKGVGPCCAGLTSDESVVIVGTYNGSADFDPGEGQIVRSSHSAGSDIFVLKLNPDFSFAWVGTIGGPAFDKATGLAVDADDNVVLSGEFRSAVDFDPSEEGADVHHVVNGPSDTFITKLGRDGSYHWTRTLPPDFTDRRRLAVDGDGNVLLVGSFDRATDFDPTEGFDVRPAPAQVVDGYVIKLGADGSYLWTRTLQDAYHTHPQNVVVDAEDNVLVVGLYWGTVDLDPGVGIRSQTADGGDDIFLLLCL